METTMDARALPLRGVIVLDLTRALSGPYGTLMLADLGARVIKVEAPVQGDDSRHFPPMHDGRPVYFSSVNRDKESIALDLKNAADRVVFERLLAEADVLVENFRPGVMQRLGYDWPELHARWPSLVMASISGFGQTGPYARRTAYDMVAQAMGGIMSVTGEESGEPVRVGVSIGDLAAGMYAATAIASALYQRTHTGAGRYIDIAMMDCQVALLENAMARHLATGEIPGRVGSRHPTITPFGAFQAADGYLAVCVGTEQQFQRLCELIGRPELPQDERFRDIAQRNQHEPLLKSILNDALQLRPRAHWLTKLEECGIPGGPINSVAELAGDPQVAARGMLIEATHPTQPAHTLVRTPFAWGDTEQASRTYRAAPLLDEHRAALAREFGF